MECLKSYKAWEVREPVLRHPVSQRKSQGQGPRLSAQSFSYRCPTNSHMDFINKHLYTSTCVPDRGSSLMFVGPETRVCIEDHIPYV